MQKMIEVKIFHIQPGKALKMLDIPGICRSLFYRSSQLELVKQSIAARKFVESHEMTRDFDLLAWG